MKGISGNIIKILGAILMLIDHIGVVLFPRVLILRIIGRISFPLFAFMIAEGAKYTKNKFKYFLSIFILGIICQIFNYFFNNKSLYMSILITFSISLLLIYLIDFIKKLIFEVKINKVLSIIIAVISITIALYLTYILCIYVQIDYGFFGILVPVGANILDFRRINTSSFIKKLDKYLLRLLLFTVMLVLLAYDRGINQFYSLLAVGILLFYSQKRGKYKMKYFFYLFYPLHLACLYGIDILLNILQI